MEVDWFVPDAPYPILRTGLGALAALLSDADLGARFLRAYLPLADRVRIQAASRSMQLYVHVYMRAYADEMAHLARLAPRAERLAPWMTRWVLASLRRKVDQTRPTGARLSPVGADNLYVSTPFVSQYYGVERLRVVTARLHPAPRVMPLARTDAADGNVFTLDLLQTRVIGELVYARRARGFWRFVPEPYAGLGADLRDAEAVTEAQRALIAETAQRRQAVGANVAATQRCYVHAQVVGAPLGSLLAEQGRTLFDYVAALRRIRNDMNLEQHLVDSGELALDGVFAVLGALHVTDAADPTHDISVLLLGYVGKTQEQTVHAIR